MKRTIYLLILCGSINSLLAQTTAENYITTKTYTKNDNSTAITQIQYVDGLGRPIETVVKASSPLGKDLVTTVVYDGNGRESQKWLPATSANTDGSFINVIDFQSIQTATYSDTKPYSQTKYESSPIGRASEQFGVGQVWYNANKRSTADYAYNNSEVRYYYADGNNQLVRAGNYISNTLYKTTTKDEDGKQSIEYKDKMGRVVMQRRGTSTYSDTYYVYNDYGQLVYVLPPLPQIVENTLVNGVYSETTDVVKKYGYFYKYDERGNCNYKKLPGCEPIYMIYDKANRLVLSQDGNQRTKPQWTITKYDILGRVLYTGVINREIAQSEKDIIHNNVIIEDKGTNNQLSNTGYTCNTFINEITPLTVNYYDAYNYFLSILSSEINTNLTYTTKSGGYSTAFTTSHPSADGLSSKGLLTGTRTYLLDDSGNYTTSVNYYDDKRRVVQTRSTNHLGGYDIVYNDLDFTGKPNRTLKEHGIAGLERVAIVGEEAVYEPSAIELYTYTYDHAGRVIKTEYILNNNPAITLSDMTAEGSYDELGRLKTKKRHNGTDTESFEYNIRNWTTKINSGTFEENLYYNNVPNNSAAQSIYNGNISVSTWTYNGQINGYTYYYDELNRLTSTYSILNNQFGDYYYSESFGYDKIGNVSQLQRWDNQDVMDGLGLYYNGNQLKYVTDNGISQNLYNVKEYQNKADEDTEFFYDANGNLIKDLDREITEIQYNILNLPKKVTFANGNTIENTYDTGGRKLSSRYLTKVPELSLPVAKTTSLVPRPINTLLYTGTETNYIGNIEYDTEIEIYSAIMMEPTYNLARIYNPEGYVTTVTNPFYYYFRKDHLGNNREVWCANTGETIQRTQYYPSGLPWAESTGQEVQNKKYNGKEFVEAHGLDEYDSAARWYYPAINRTSTLDPLAEKYYSISPYAWCANNPVNRIDPKGQDILNVDGGVKYTGNDAVRAFTGFQMLYYSQQGVTINNIHFVFQSVTPNIYEHTLNSFKKGKPNILHYITDKAITAMNTKIAMKESGLPTKTGFHRDEYPYKSTIEGGTGADVAYVPASENLSQGGSLAILYSKMKNGDAFLVLPVPEKVEKQPRDVPVDNPIPVPDLNTKPINQRLIRTPSDENIGTAAAAAGVGYVLWEVFKWASAVIAAPSTGGLSMEAATVIP